MNVVKPIVAIFKCVRGVVGALDKNQPFLTATRQGNHVEELCRSADRFPKWMLWLCVVLVIVVLEVLVVVSLEVHGWWVASHWRGAELYLLIVLFLVLPKMIGLPTVVLGLLYCAILEGSIARIEVQGKACVSSSGWVIAMLWALCNLIVVVFAVYLAEVVYIELEELFEFPYGSPLKYPMRLALASFFSLLPLFYYLRYVAKRKRKFIA